MSNLNFKNEKEFINECAQTASQFSKNGNVECVFYVEMKPIKSITFERETNVEMLRADVEMLRAEVGKLKAEKKRLKKKHLCKFSGAVIEETIKQFFSTF